MQAARGASLTSDARTPPVRSRYGLIFGVAAAALLVDIVTKVLVVQNFALGEVRSFLSPVLKLHYVTNSGAAFSTGAGMTAWISVFGCIAFVVVLVVARKVRTPLWAVAMGLLLAGISGNLVDRFLREPGPLRGEVVDFLELPNWPIFNIADICINVAAGLIILQSLRGIPLAGKPAAEPDAAEADR
ncbi:MAG: signal peptidase II [Propionibacteriales bacterium]|nr:signal peptidase II [Propionibacteriales bacterium]